MSKSKLLKLADRWWWWYMGGVYVQYYGMYVRVPLYYMVITNN